MVTLSFTLTPEASARLHDVLICLSKFSESVYFEARPDRLALTALNSSKSGYASFSLAASRFFSSYECAPRGNHVDGRFTCRIYNKALLSVFKGRLIEPRGRDTAIDRCEVTVQDQQTDCRFMIRMVCNQGVTKTYRLTYESVEVMHALFDKNTANNRWSVHSGLLKEFTEYFGPRTEQLDIYSEDGKITFTSFTEKIMSGQEILKHPLQTAVSANIIDFDKFEVQEKLHIIISVKDFKAIVNHADTLNTNVGAFYSTPSRPLQFSYEAEGMYCQFTLMTTGDVSQASTRQANRAQGQQSRESSRVPSAPSTVASHRKTQSSMPPPQLPASRNSPRRLGRQTTKEPSAKPSRSEPGSSPLFVPQNEDDDHRWDPMGYREDEEILGWDASADYNSGFHPTFRDTTTLSRGETREADEGLPPTQHISQIKGLW